MLKANIQTIFDTSAIHAEFKGVSIDSRNCAGMLFIAIVGERFDGHDFVEDAVSNGAVAVVVSTTVECNVPVIKVANTIQALGTIANYHRNTIEPTIIGITGSNGKTTTKNMLYSIFSQVGKTFKTPGNLNNHIGVPLSLLQLTHKHQFAIIEMGANHVGEIAYLRALVEPDIACVINTLDAHIGEFGGKENLIKAKGEIYHPKSKNVVNTNTIYSGDMSFGVGGDIDYDYLSDIQLSLLGEHNKENALAAAAIAQCYGIGDEDIKKGLEHTTGEEGRMQLIPTEDFLIINDSYNASPSAMRFALETLSQRTETTVAVLGNIAEIGNEHDSILRSIGEYAKRLDIDYLYSVGEGARHYDITHFDDITSLVKHLIHNHKHTTLLFKASRVARLERAIVQLQRG